MRLTVALLAVVLSALAAAGYGDDDAEPGAPSDGASLVLDFQPNAVHTGLYAAEENGFFADEGIDLEISEPSGTADGAKLLEAGRADFAILDINDFGLARQRGLDLAAIASIVQRPLASVIAADESEVKAPADLDGATVGVTGVPSDDAVLDTILAGGGLDPDSVERKTIGFQAVSLLASGRIDAATAFWNAEGVALRQQGIPVRELRVDEFGAPRYPELVLVARAEDADEAPAAGSRVCSVLQGLQRGYAELGLDPNAALAGLLAALPSSEADSQRAQLAALVAEKSFEGEGVGGGATTSLHPEATEAWAAWAAENGILTAAGRKAAVDGFQPELLGSCTAKPPAEPPS
jgi:NitT/TauT family transport system substrate-binding protein/putative hydroxymethylpyrimidine transport system substrate-binding protein